MNPELEDLYQQVILDHSKRPRNFGRSQGAVHVHGDNPSCGDEIDLHVRFGPERRGRGHQIHRPGLRDQPGLRLDDDDEAERQAARRGEELLNALSRSS